MGYQGNQIILNPAEIQWKNTARQNRQCWLQQSRPMKYSGLLLLFGAALLRLPSCAGRASWPQNRWIYPKCRALRISGRGVPIPSALPIFVEAPETHRNHPQTCPWLLKTGRLSYGFPALLILPLHQPSFERGQSIGDFFAVRYELADRCISGVGRCQFSQHRNIL